MAVQSWGAAPPQLQSCGGKLPPLPPPPPGSRVPALLCTAQLISELGHVLVMKGLLISIEVLGSHATVLCLDPNTFLPILPTC